MEFILSILTGILYTASFYMMLRRSVVKLIFGLVLFSHASNLLILTLGRLSKGNPPIIPEDAELLTAPYADPLPQAMILTAIVISFGIQVFAIVLIKRVYEETGSDDLDKLTSTDKIQ
jgi:multicomponent Na+:H+ antiporter subunit C